MTGETQTAETPFGSLVSIGLEQTSTVDRVVEELRRAVFEGELESGTPLREVALAESLGVSRPTVREALTVLVADGLATREPHRGVAVATPDPESIGDVSRARGVLELAGVRHWDSRRGGRPGGGPHGPPGVRRGGRPRRGVRRAQPSGTWPSTSRSSG